MSYDPLLSSTLEHKQANQSVASVSSDRSLTASVKLIQSFQIFVFFRLRLWISSSSWLNVETGELLKLKLVIQQDSTEIYVLYLSKIKR